MRRRALVKKWLPVVAPLLVLGLCETNARAEGFYWGLRYNTSLPVGSVRTFVPDVAPVGFDLDARYWFGNNLSIGVDGAWNRFSNKLEFGTYPLSSGAITATIYRYVEVAAVMPELHYYFGPERAVVPFVGVAAGFSMVWFKTLVSDLDFREKKPGFMFAPEAGILIPFDRDPEVLRQAFIVGLRYAFSTSGIDTAQSHVANTSFIALQLGALVY